jgi:hypothetical protein
MRAQRILLRCELFIASFGHVQMNTKLTNAEVISSKMMRPRRYAEVMGINYRTFYDYLYRGAIPYYKFQGILLIDVEEADPALAPVTANLMLGGNSSRHHWRKKRIRNL